MNINNLKGIIPEKVLAEIPGVISEFDINTPLRLAHFLAQCAHESEGFKTVRENLNFKPDRIMQVWPNRFPDLLSTKGYAFNPEALANKVYAGRLGNGTEKSGDGWKFRGRGYIMTTLKNNYKAFSVFVNDPLIMDNPDLVATKYPLKSAAFFWMTNQLNKLADTNDLKGITKKVNGGYHGLEYRRAWFNKIFPKL